MTRENLICCTIAITLTICLTVASSSYSETSENSETVLTDQDKRFDFNGDGRLSEEEKEILLETVTREALMGVQLDERAIRAARRRGGSGGYRGRRGPRRAEKIVHRFDKDGDGKLDAVERMEAREYIKESRGVSGASRQSDATAPATTRSDDLKGSKAAAISEEVGLYDDNTLRTLYLRFHDDDWYEQLGDFYKTDVDVPADLIADGELYESVGVRFRGSSSYFTVRNEKKSFNIAVDANDDNQRLLRYKTLNLLNGHADASFLREVLYSRIARNYIPALRANFVKLVINGENWGIYINSQQYNKDFLSDWFDTRSGVRWKVPPGRESGLVYNGDNPADYQESYQLKTNEKEAPNAWTDLINLCKSLRQTPDDRFEAELSRIFDIDRALWFLALDNVFIDNDGYFSRGSDYSIYQDSGGRFHLLPYDSNETFRFAGGGGPNSWQTDGPMLSPVGQADDEMRPVIKRLFAIPRLRARYIAHVRTIVTDWLNWEKLEPIIAAYQSLIDEFVKADDKKLYSYEAFATSHIKEQSRGFGRGGGGRGGRGGTPSFKQFVTERREYLLSHPEINNPTPVILSVTEPENRTAGERVQIMAKISDKITVDEVILHYSSARLSPFRSLPMAKHGGAYIVEIPKFPAGTEVRYYVEARTVASYGTTAFYPATAEFEPLTFRVDSPTAERSDVIINELMASNTNGIMDAQGDHDDWIELFNSGENPVNLAGMYLSDDRANPRKWQFPEQTTIAPKGYLIVWADSDGESQTELHTNFNLSRSGETLFLVDTDERHNQVLDTVRFGAQKEDTAIARVPNGIGDFAAAEMTPGGPNP
ncbi:MAG: CotH kinase family protein [Candidatus Poribacteria bacterium]|nr:CotH kinase family protein [Candidatus Poribacteria bacterium]MDE0505497.1 CotH kinase family protein [Candidatus Poribacteria bacterium]